MVLEEETQIDLPSTGILPVDKRVVDDFRIITRCSQGSNAGRPVYERENPVYREPQEDRNY